MESSLLLLEQQKETQSENQLFTEQPVVKVEMIEQTSFGFHKQQSEPLDQFSKWSSHGHVGGYYRCEQLFDALIPFKYKSEILKKHIVVWASDRQDADEIFANLMGSITGSSI